jgi:hypothetical protein
MQRCHLLGFLMALTGLFTMPAACSAGTFGRVQFTPQGPIIPPQLIAGSYNYAWMVADALRFGDDEVKAYLKNIPGWNKAMAGRHIQEIGLPQHTWILRDGIIIMSWTTIPTSAPGWGHHAFGPPSLHPPTWPRTNFTPGDGRYYVVIWPPTLKFQPGQQAKGQLPAFIGMPQPQAIQTMGAPPAQIRVMSMRSRR